MQKIDPKLCTEILLMGWIRYVASSTDKSIFTAQWIRPSLVKCTAWALFLNEGECLNFGFRS